MFSLGVVSSQFVTSISYRKTSIPELLGSGRIFTAINLWCPLLPYGYSYKASCSRPG